MTIDPILLEGLRNRDDAIADEMELALLKSAAASPSNPFSSEVIHDHCPGVALYRLDP